MPSEEVTNLIFEWHMEPSKEEETTKVKALKGEKNPSFPIQQYLNPINRLGVILRIPDKEGNKPNQNPRSNYLYSRGGRHIKRKQGLFF